MSYYGEPLADLSGLTEFQGRDSVDLLARMIYSEARGESWTGKQGVAHVVKNRKAKNIAEFGGGTYEGVILKGTFDGMNTLEARQPDINSGAWDDCLYIASNMATQNNPIGTCLWFVTNIGFGANSNSTGQYKFPNTTSGYQDVVEKVVIGNHTFFRVAGY